jgi:lipoprotein-anchoring transpeptidase ErfK/SrfK
MTPSPTPTWTASPTAIPPTATPARGEKWIDIDLSTQTLVAYEGEVEVFRTTVSTGAPQTPTVTGRFRIFRKLLLQTMTGPDYEQPDVPYVMYFYGAYSIHGAYWHNDFGRARSHGCVNLRVPEAQWLFQWADPQLPAGASEIWDTIQGTGTLVVVHE